MKCPLDENEVYDRSITVYGLGISVLYCKDCIKERLLICSICGLFRLNGDKINQDPFIEEYHPNKDHKFIEVTDDILKQLLKCNNHGFFNYNTKVNKNIIIEI